MEWLSREQVQQVPCPRCEAQTGECCRGRRGERKSNHKERCVLAAQERRAQRDGSEPLPTAKQLAYLERLWEATGAQRRVPLTRREASDQIEALNARKRTATAAQVDYIVALRDELGVDVCPLPERFDEASAEITRLVARKQRDAAAARQRVAVDHEHAGTLILTPFTGEVQMAPPSRI